MLNGEGLETLEPEPVVTVLEMYGMSDFMIGLFFPQVIRVTRTSHVIDDLGMASFELRGR